jgi:hypothetical protein
MTDAQDFAAYRRSVEDLGRLRLFRYIVFPPRDLRYPLFEVEPDVKAGGYLAEASCVHRYPGPYDIGVVCAARIENPISRLGRVRIVATFEDSAGRQIAEVRREVDRAGRVWWAGPARNGFGLACYAVPADVPVQQKLHCRVEISDLDGALAHYRPQFVYSKCNVQK